VALPRSRILQLELSRRHDSYWRLGGTLGLLVGVGVGALIVRGKTYSLGDNTPVYEVLGSMAAGGLVGATVGGSIRRDRWETVAWPAGSRR
jgi:hypothetical protein